MIDNFFEEDSYHSYDKVYTDMVSQHSIYLGDAQAAMDNDFHMRCQIQTGTWVILRSSYCCKKYGACHHWRWHQTCCVSVVGWKELEYSGILREVL